MLTQDVSPDMLPGFIKELAKHNKQFAARLDMDTGTWLVSWPITPAKQA